MPCTPHTLHRRSFVSPVAAASLLRAGAVALVGMLLGLAGLACLPASVVLRQLLLAPWLEEIVFRLGLQSGLQRQARWPWLRAHGAGLSALAFAGAHLLARLPQGSPAALALAAATGIPAWWIGRDFARNASLARCALWHAGFNAFWLLLLQPRLLPL